MEVGREHVGGVVAGGGHQVDPGVLHDLGHAAYVATEAEHGEVDHRAHPELVELLQPGHGPVEGVLRVPLGVGEVQVELGVSDEDVLVDEGEAEVSGPHRPRERLDLPHLAHSAASRMPS